MGQQQMRRSRFFEAHQSFTTALGLDSTFALAAMALETAQSWSPVNYGGANHLPLAYRHRNRLTPRDSIVLHMRIPGTFAGRPMTLREVSDLRERMVLQVPDRPEAWYLIGDAYFHRGTAMGLSRDEAVRRADNALRRVLALDPDLSYIKFHLAQMHLGPTSLQRLKDLSDSLGIASPSLDIATAVMSGDSTNVAAYRDRLRALDPDQLAEVTYLAQGTPIGDLAYEQGLARSTTADQRANLVMIVRAGLWMQGRPQQARREHQRLEELGAAPATVLSPSVVFAALFDDGDSLLATEAVAATAARLRLGTARPEPTLFAHRAGSLIAGLWSAHVGDTTMLRAAIARLDAIGARTDSTHQAGVARLYADALRLVSTTGQPDRTLLDAFEAATRVGPAVVGPIPEIRSALNLIAARSWERSGDMRRASMAAERAATWDVTALVQHAALRDVGRTKLAAGDTAGAERAWKEFLFWRNRAEPAQRKSDDQIRAKLAELERARK
jgi:hypothetical protein